MQAGKKIKVKVKKNTEEDGRYERIRAENKRSTKCYHVQPKTYRSWYYKCASEELDPSYNFHKTSDRS